MDFRRGSSPRIVRGQQKIHIIIDYYVRTQNKKQKNSEPNAAARELMDVITMSDKGPRDTPMTETES